MPRKTGVGRGYRMTDEHFAAVKLLSLRIAQTLEEVAPSAEPRKLAASAEIRSGRLRALLSAHGTDAPAGELRRPRRSTLDRLAGALGLPDTVVDLWCREAPDAIAPEAAR